MTSQLQHAYIKKESYLLVSIGTYPCCFIILGTVHIWAVIKSPVSSPDGSPSSLVEKMPVETRKGSVLCAFVLQKQWALLGPELLQISRIKTGIKLHKSAKHNA